MPGAANVINTLERFLGSARFWTAVAVNHSMCLLVAVTGGIYDAIYFAPQICIYVWWRLWVVCRVLGLKNQSALSAPHNVIVFYFYFVCSDEN